MIKQQLIKYNGSNSEEILLYMIGPFSQDIVATAALGQWHTESPYVHSVWVHEVSRRHGFGRALIRKTIELAKSANKIALKLWVHRDNTQALALYKAEGFFATDRPDGDGLVMMVHPLSQ